MKICATSFLLKNVLLHEKKPDIGNGVEPSAQYFWPEGSTQGFSIQHFRSNLQVIYHQAQSKQVLVLIWDNASWHVSKQVKTWLREHNQMVLQEASTGKQGVRIIPCWLPTKSPWLNKIEPKWVHGKRAIVEPARLLTASEVRQRVCDYFGCEQAELLVQQV